MKKTVSKHVLAFNNREIFFTDLRNVISAEPEYVGHLMAQVRDVQWTSYAH